MDIIQLSGTCDASGDLTITGTTNVVGFVEKVVMDYDDGDTGCDLTLTNEAVVSEPILAATALGVADKTWYPRASAVDGVDAAAFTNEQAAKYFVTGSFKAVIENGGVSKNFKFLVYLSDE